MNIQQLISFCVFALERERERERERDPL